MSRILVLFTVLILCCSSGFALKCYSCVNQQNCLVQECPASEDACLKVSPTGVLPSLKCYSYNKCKLEILQSEYGFNLEYKCCQKDLCNNSVIFLINKVVLGVVALFTCFINMAFV